MAFTEVSDACVSHCTLAQDALWVLAPMLVIGKSLDTAEFQRQVEPVVVIPLLLCAEALLQHTTRCTGKVICEP